MARSTSPEADEVVRRITSESLDTSAIKSIIFEMAVPSPSHSNDTWYHGTHNVRAARAISVNGIQPGNIDTKRRGHLAPVAGKVYLTRSIQYAQIYAIGGDYAGSDNEYIRERFTQGYVFVIPGTALKDVQPDEDSVGLAVNYADTILNHPDNIKYYEEDPFFAALSKESRGFLLSLLSFAQSRMTATQFQKAIGGEIAYHASGGKRLLKSMSDEMKLKLIDLGAHVAHEGAVWPTATWTVTIDDIPRLKRDGSNFFEVAKKIQ